MPGITIIGSGTHTPGKPVTNHDLMRVMDTNDAWIQKRTGIRQRHYADEGEGVSDLATKAAEKAIASAGITAQDIDYIIFATMTPDYIFPGSGGITGANLGIPGVPALDIRQQCAAMPFAFQVADGLVNTGAAKHILVIGAEAHAGFMPWSDWDILYDTNSTPATGEAWDRATRHRSLAILFGDGAGALVMKKSDKEGYGLIGAEIHTDGREYNKIYMPGGGFRRRPHWSAEMLQNEEHLPLMDGKELFKHAVTKLPAVVKSLCAKHNVSFDDIDIVIPHQANERINRSVAKALELPEHKVASNIERFGNTSGATIPILVDELRRENRVSEGDLALFVALGSGLHWGAALMRL